MGFGAIIRDFRGHVVAARGTAQSSIVDPIVVEAWAGMVAANLCKDVAVFDIILWGDFQQVVNKINVDSPNASKYGYFVDGLKHVFKSFRSSQVVHVKRDGQFNCTSTC